MKCSNGIYCNEEEIIEDLKKHYGKKSEDILFSMKILSVVPIRDEMTEAQFDQMMTTGLKQAKQGDSLDIDEVFAELKRRISEEVMLAELDEAKA